MSKGRIKTDNSFLSDKIKLRLNHLPRQDNINVLDCFAGEGVIWDSIKKRTDKSITVVGIEQKNKKGVYLKGNNLKFIKNINLNNFQIIDLDSYGVPYPQLKILFDRKFKGGVFVTFIQSLYGGLPKKMLYDLGYTEKMIDAIPSLFNRKGIEKFMRFLYMNGVRKVCIRSCGGKHYLYFKIF